MGKNEKVSVSLRERLNAFRNPHTRSQDNSLKSALASIIGGASASGINVTEESSLKFSAVWLARRILSELPASLPVEVYEEKGNNRTSIDHPVKALLTNPNMLMNSFTWHELMNDWLQGWGNGLSIIKRTGGRAIELIPIHPASIDPVVTDGRIFYNIDDKDMGVKGTFFAEEVVHFKMFTSNGLWGRGPIQMARDNIGLAMAAERYGSKFFRKGGNLKAVIEAAGHLSDLQFKEFKKRWDTTYTGDEGDFSTPILEHGMVYKPLGMAPEAAQFLQTRQFSVVDVARWFNLPPHMLADLSRSTFSNIEHQDLQLIKYTLRPILKREETELENKLLLPGERGRIKIRYNLDALLRGDLASVTNHIKEMVLSGVICPDEGRSLLNKNPRPGGSEYYTPANIVGNQNKTA
jgi:HK97 family phage portal protein